MAKHIREPLWWVFALVIALGGCASPSKYGHPPDAGPLDEGSPRSSTLQSPNACPSAESMYAGAQRPDGEDALEEQEDGEPNLHPEIQAPSEEAEDVSFLSEFDQSGLQPDDSPVLPVESNERVEAFIQMLQGSQRGWMERSLRRSGRYSQRMKEILREEGLPEDLVYLALIESGFNPYAYSRARAMGIWQFIPGTARRHGLVINWWVDERRDLEKSTRAAAQYLKNLYALFDDWYLAAAAYNAGEGKLQRAIRKYDSNCFWDLSRHTYLRRETKNYVPTLLAALKIAKDPEQYGFGAVEPDPPLLYDTVTVPDATDLAVIAKGCGESLSVLNSLNPQLQRGCTPPDYPDYEVKIPLGAREAFLDFYSQLDPAKRLTFRRHQIRQGDTLSRIASRYGVSVDSIVTMNHLKSRHAIREGRSLIIPLPASYQVAVQETRTSEPEPVKKADLSGQAGRKVVHVVRKGDSLWRISKRYGVSVASLRRWNPQHSSSRLRPGQKVVVWLKEPAAKEENPPRLVEAKAQVADAEGQEIWYTVRAGDSLWQIAKRYGVTVGQISRWNQIDARQPIQPGIRLRIYKEIQLNADLQALSPASLPD